MRSFSDKPIVVDGSNLAYLDKSEPSIDRLIAVRTALERNDCHDLTVIVDASLKHRVPATHKLRLLKMLDRGEVKEAPAGVKADAFIVPLAQQRDGFIISNDRFLEWRDRWPQLESRRITVMEVNGDILFTEPAEEQAVERPASTEPSGTRARNATEPTPRGGPAPPIVEHPYSRFKESKYDESYRAVHLKELGRFLARGEGVQVIAPPGWGKSNFLRLAAAHPTRAGLTETYMVAYLAPSQVYPERLGGAMSNEAHRLFGGFGVPEDIQALPPLEAFLKLADPILRDGRPIIVILDSPSDDLEYGSLAFLADVRDAAGGRIQYVLGLRRPWGATRAGPIYELIARRLWLAPLSESESRLDVARRFPELHDERRSAVIKLAGGCPQLQKFLCFAALNQSLSLSDLDSLLDQDGVGEYFSELWEYLTADERQALASICRGERLAEVPELLLRSGIVRSDRSGFSPLLTRWVRLACVDGGGDTE